MPCEFVLPLTITEVAASLGQPAGRVYRALARSAIKPVAHVGYQRLYSPGQLSEIQAAIATIQPRPRKAVRA